MFMILKEGDKVKFLNDRGGGIVSSVIDSRMVNVIIEGGFEIPVLASELIRIVPENAAGRFFDEDFLVPVIQKQDEKAATIEDERVTSLPQSVSRQRKSEEIFLAFIPHDQKWLITGLIDIYLINNSSYDLLYNLFFKDETGRHTGKDYGSIFPDTTLLLDSIDREALNEWGSGVFQFLFHKDHPAELLPPFNAEFGISGKNFYQEGSYKESPYFTGKGILLKIVSLDDYFKGTSKPAGRKDVQQSKDGKSLLEKHRSGEREAEVDLHIHSLVEENTNMDVQEILEFQKSYFIKCLEEAISGHFLKVTFIHGVGNGILREEILGILKSYEGIEVSDAPITKYGVGAVVIRIPHNYLSAEIKIHQ